MSPNEDNKTNTVDASRSLSFRDSASKDRVAAGQKRRDKREKARELKAKYKEIRNNSRSTSDTRSERESFKADLKDIDTGLESNKSGTGSTVQDDSIDNVDSTESSGGDGGGGGLPDGYAEELLDVVNDDNTAGQRYFLTKPV